MTPQLVVLAVDSQRCMVGPRCLAGTGSTGSQGHHRDHVVCFAANAAPRELTTAACMMSPLPRGHSWHRDQGALCRDRYLVSCHMWVELVDAYALVVDSEPSISKGC